MARAKEFALQSLLLIVLLGFLYPGTFLHGEIAMPGEQVYKYPPWASNMPADAEIPDNWLTQDALSAFNTFFLLVETAFDEGEWPLWNNMQFMGAPLLANYQTAVFYPPRLLHRILEFHTATTAFMLLKFFLCGMTAYICGRGLGRSIGASRFLSIGWMLCLYNVTWCYWPLPDVSAWLPLMFLAVEYILDRRYRRGYCLLAFSATMFMLAGHPETALTMAAFLGLYFILRVASDRTQWSRKVLVAGLAWVVVLFVCAIQLLPFLEYLPQSFTLENRPNSDEGSAYALPLSTAVLFIVPRFFGMMTDGNYWADAPANSNYSAMFYVGVVAWISAAAGIVTGNRRRVACLAVPAALSMVLVLDTPIADAVKSLPLLNATRSGYFAGFGLFAILLLASMGIDTWFTRRRSVRERYPVAAAAVIVGFLPVAFYFIRIMDIHEAGVNAYVVFQMGLTMGFCAVMSAVFAVGGLTKVPVRPVQALLAVILALDLLVAGRGIIPTSPRDTFFPDTALTQQAAALDQPARVRILPMFAPSVPPGFVAPYGIEQFHGYDAIVPARFMHYISLMARGGWDKMSRVCAVDEIWSREGVPLDLSETAFVGEFEGVQVYREPAAFERAFLVGRARAIGDWRELLSATLEEDYDPSQEVLADWLPQGDLPQTDSGDLGSIQITERTTNTVKMDVQASERCYLVLADAFYPGWEARIDGASVEVFPAYHAFRGIVVPPGDHRVVFEFRPRSFRIGMGISVVALTLSLILNVWTLRRVIAARR